MSTKSILRFSALALLALGLYGVVACVPPPPDFSCLRCESECPGGLTCSTDGYCLSSGETSALCGVKQEPTEPQREPPTGRKEATTEPTPEPTNEPTAEPTPEPKVEPADEPDTSVEPASEPDTAGEPTPEPSADEQSTPDATEPSSDAGEALPEPQAEPLPEPTQCELKDGTPCTLGKGECTSKGLFVCEKGTLTCNAQPAPPTPEVCDGKDNDCDGNIDNIQGKTSPMVRDCYNGNKGCTKQGNTYKCEGICQQGTQTCQSGQWSACQGEIPPKAETCDGKDEDCDGSIDNGLTCVCKPGTKEACYPSNQGCTKQADGSFQCTTPCKAGSRTCDSKGAWGNCIGVIGPQAELCDGKDNNCDGKVDEKFTNLGKACSVGKGLCQRSGKYVCHTNKTNVVCNAQPGPSAKEVCDGKDNDCDGQVDEGLSTRTYFQDYDRDGFGNPRAARKHCAPISGYVTNPGDCYDRNRDARPNQTGYFDRHRGDGSFDYNCDGNQEKKSLSCNNCSGNRWKNSGSNVCGKSEKIEKCIKVAGVCNKPNNGTKVQACR